MSHQDPQAAASSAEASSPSTTVGLTNADSRAIPSGNAASKCCLPAEMPSLVTVSYLQASLCHHHHCTRPVMSSPLLVIAVLLQRSGDVGMVYKHAVHMSGHPMAQSSLCWVSLNPSSSEPHQPVLTGLVQHFTRQSNDVAVTSSLQGLKMDTYRSLFVQCAQYLADR